MLELRGVTKKFFAIPVVNSVSFTLRSGEIVGYLGPNGAGKTTTIKMLAGLIEPSNGEIFFNGKNIWENINEYKERIGYVPEHSELYPYLTGYEYLKLVGRLRLIPEKILEEKINGFMELFGLEADMHSELSSYSKGMKQKILISSALLHNPDVLLLDEPLSGLDVATSLVLRSTLKKLSEEGKIILYSSHILEEVEKICTRVIIIHKGTILADDSSENLRNLMNVKSLEEVFQQLVLKIDEEGVAEKMVGIMKRG